MSNECRKKLVDEGFAVVENVFSANEITLILEEINMLKIQNLNHKKNGELFAIRHFLKESPDLQQLVMSEKLKNILATFEKPYRLIKSVYFDKPPKANWSVNWHQDLTVSLKNKTEVAGFKNWLPKEDYFSVQPPEMYLKDIITLRIHLDDCHRENGALRVIPASHMQVLDIKEMVPGFLKSEKTCEVKKGGVLAMKPLLWHSSRRTNTPSNRRVVHLEFSSLMLPEPLEWNEYSL